MLGMCLTEVRRQGPLVHCITNYVTVNDVANILLACGGSPIMADDESEVSEITSLCNALDINIGTLNQRTIASMHVAGKMANKLGHPALLDPVGAGASLLRTDTALELLEDMRFTAIRGNISEIKCLALGSRATKGVDADASDVVTDENLEETISFAKAFARSMGSVVAITGAIDIVADGARASVIRNGHLMMSSVTGTGCMLSGLMSAFIAANPDRTFDAATAAVCTMGLAGEVAYRRLSEGEGNCSYRNRIIDAVYHMSADRLEKGAKYELR